MLSRPSNQGAAGRKAQQEPAITTTEKYMDCILTGNSSFVCSNLDPRILVQSPMGYFFGRPICKGWLAFECSVFATFAELIIVKNISSVDGMKVAKLEWCVGGLHFEDVIHLNQMLQFRGITRSMKRQHSCQEDQDVAEAVLLALTGPYFAPHCGPKKLTPHASRIDNQALILPIIDYTYKGLATCADILRAHPNGAKPVEDTAVSMHFMSDALERRKEQVRIRKQSQGIQSGKPDMAKEFGRSEDKIAIKARNREGDQKVLFVDKADLNRTSKTSKVEAMEDDEVLNLQSKRNMYICSGARYANNALSNPVDLAELSVVIKSTIINAFYFLTVVDLSSNALTSIPDLSEFPLVSLQLHGNNISDWAETEKLNKLSKLQSLTLFGNPLQHDCESVRTYKYQLLALFYLDGSQALSKVAKSKRRGTGPPSGRNYALLTAALPDEDNASLPTPVPANLSPIPKRSASSAASRVAPISTSEDAVTQGYISLRSLDHSVVSPKEVDVVRTFKRTFERKREALSSKKEVVKEIFNPYIKKAPTAVIPRHSPLFGSAVEEEQGAGIAA